MLNATLIFSTNISGAWACQFFIDCAARVREQVFSSLLHSAIVTIYIATYIIIYKQGSNFRHHDLLLSLVYNITLAECTVDAGIES